MGTLSLTKEARIYNAEKTASSTSGDGKTEQLRVCFFFLMKLEHFLTPYTKINSKWIKNLNVRLETIKLLEETIGSIPFDINCTKILSDTPRIMEIKTKINR